MPACLTPACGRTPLPPSAFVGLRPILRRLVAGDSAEDDRLDGRIAAEAVGAMDTAGRFAGCKETWNRLAALGERLRPSVDGNAAHRVVDTRLYLDRAEGRLREW